MKTAGDILCLLMACYASYRFGKARARGPWLIELIRLTGVYRKAYYASPRWNLRTQDALYELGQHITRDRSKIMDPYPNDVNPVDEDPMRRNVLQAVAMIAGLWVAVAVMGLVVADLVEWWAK